MTPAASPQQPDSPRRAQLEPPPKPLSAPRLRRLYRDLHKLSATVRQVLEHRPVETLNAKVTPDQLRVLRYIAPRLDLHMGALAQGLGIKAPSACQHIDRLAAKGLVLRRPDPADRRTVRVELTPTGQALVKSVQKEVDARLEAALDVLGAPDAQRLSTLIDVFVRALAKAEERSG